MKCFVSIGFLCGCRFVSQLGFSSGPVTGLLGRTAAFRDFFSIKIIVFCLLSVAALFW